MLIADLDGSLTTAEIEAYTVKLVLVGAMIEKSILMRGKCGVPSVQPREGTGLARRREGEAALREVAKGNLAEAIHLLRFLLTMAGACEGLADDESAQGYVADEIAACLPFLRGAAAGCKTQGELRAFVARASA